MAHTITELGFLPVGSNGLDVDESQQRAVVAHNPGGAGNRLALIDISDPSNPVEIDSYPGFGIICPRMLWPKVWTGEFDDAKVKRFDVSGDNVTLDGQCSAVNGASATGTGIIGGRAFTIADDGSPARKFIRSGYNLCLEAYTDSIPSAVPDINEFGRQPILDYGSVAYVAWGGYGLDVFDITDPDNWVFVNNYLEGVYTTTDLAIYDHYLYVANRQRVVIYDIINPYVPSLVNTISLNRVYAVATLEHYLVAGNYTTTGEVRLYDLTDPVNPSFDTSLSLVGGTVSTSHITAFQVTEQYVYCSTNDGQFFILETDPILGPLPESNFSATPTSGNVELTVDFTDLSTGSPTSWDWNFGDGSPHSTEQNPTHVYVDVGTYTVSLSVSNLEGNDTEIKADYITVSGVHPDPERIVIYVDSLHGSNGNKGDLQTPYRTLEFAAEKAFPGATLILQEGTGTSYGDLEISKNLTIRAAYGATPKVGKLSITKAQCLIEGLRFENLAKGIEVFNDPFGATTIKECVFENVVTPIELNQTNYISIHRNFFKNFTSGIQINQAIEVNVSSNIFTEGLRSIEVLSVERLDLWRNNIYGAGGLPPIPDPGDNLRVIYRTLTPSNISNKRVGLPGFATLSDTGIYEVGMNVVNGPSFGYDQDYTVTGSGSIVSWDGLQLENEFEVGDLVRIKYVEGDAPVSGEAIRAFDVGDVNSRIDSNNITGAASDISLGVYFNTPLKIRYNNFYKNTTWYDGSTATDEEGNFASDPLYTDPSNDDFRLQVLSPDIDRGDPERWDNIIEEMGIQNIGGYTGGLAITRANVAPFNRDLDYTGTHRIAVDASGDVGAWEHNPNEGSLGNYVAEDGYDRAYPGTESEPYATLDRGYSRAGSQDLHVETRQVPYQDGENLTEPIAGPRYGRYRSRNIVLSDSNIKVGEEDGDVVYIYPSYPSFETGAVYVSPDGDDGYTGTEESPFRTIDRAIQEGTPSIIVKPGIYPKFTGESGIKLIGVEETKGIPFGTQIYADFTLGTWVGGGSFSVIRKKITIEDAQTITSSFTFTGTVVDFKLLSTVGGDKLTVKLDNGSNEIFYVLDKLNEEMILGYNTDGNTYEFPFDLSANPIADVLTNLRHTIRLEGSSFSVRANNAYVNDNIAFSLGTGYGDPWTISFITEGTGDTVVSDITIDTDSFDSFVGETGTEMYRKVYAIKGATGIQG